MNVQNAAGPGLAVAVGAVAGAVGWLLFVRLPGDLADLLGVVLAVAVLAAGVALGGRLAGARFPSYNVAEVAVDGPITRDGGQPGPLSVAQGGVGADAIVEQIERADADGAVDGLLVRLNTPGGEIVPSDDLRRAVSEFDGPTIAYATDVCASGGYLIAAGCDQLWAREQTLVGSIGVRGSRRNAAELADRLGIRYEQFTAGEYKDAGAPLKDIQPDERRYLQGIVDDFYRTFVERVAAGRDIDPQLIQETEAKVFLGGEAAEIDLVDRIGTRADAEAAMEGRLAEPASVRAFEPGGSLTDRVGLAARRVAYAAGAGVASRLTADGDRLRFRY